jgi:hypothetical protein
VWDIVQPQGERAGAHNLQLLFHFTPTSSAQVLDNGGAVRNLAENAGLLILPRSDRQWTASIVKGDARPEQNYWQGFVSGGFGNPLVPTECAIFEHRGSLPAAVATVLFPYPKSRRQDVTAKLLPASRGETALAADQAFGLDIASAEGRDVVIACREPGTVTNFGELTCDGRVAVVRYNKQGDVISLILVDGSVLRLGEDDLLDTGGKTARYIECGRGPAVAAAGVRVHAEGLSVIGIDW